jgi:hypothetical protein
MAEPTKRVAVITAAGDFATIDEKYADEIERTGGRRLTRQEEAQRAVDERYEALPTWRKVAGAVGTAASAVTPLTVGSTADAPPEVQAYSEGVGEGLTGGLLQAGTRKIADAVGGQAAGDRYAEQIEQSREASPIAHGIGTTAGMIAGSVVGGESRAARALPSAGISAAGVPVEAFVERQLAGLATKGALGRATTTAAGLAARGAVEGAAFSGLDQASNNVLNNKETGDKLYAAMGHGALTGSGLGAILGFGGSLGASGARAASSKIARAFGRGGNAAKEAAGELAAQQAAGVPAPYLSASDLEAGIREGAPRAESPFSVGGEFATLKPGGKPRSIPTEDAISFRRGVTVDTDAGLRGALDEPGATMHTAGSLNSDVFNLSKGVPAEGGAYRDFTEPHLIDAEAGIARKGQSGKFQGKLPTEDAIVPANRKGVRRVDMGDVEGELPEARSPIKVAAEEGPAATGPKLGGIVDALNNPTNAARGYAQDQAWKAVGAGFGLQTTRYAKQAAKYLPDGTRGAGEIAIRYGIVDMGDQAATPFQAALTAAKTGTPAEMLPRITAAKDSVGQQLGEITEASGARVHEDDLRKAFKAVRDPLDKIAGNEHVVDAIDRYAESLGTKLRAAPDGTVSVQDLLEQRKGLDQIVYQETRTMDPGRRVQALRDIRGKLEDVIEEAMDSASGKVPGELKAKYKALKRDFTGLSILEEAAEDSAARASKHATLGFAEKTAALMGLATGHVGAPVLAVGSKFVKERGNAAAAAFLTRAADSGMIETAVSKFNDRVKRAAGGVLRESTEAARSRPKLSPQSEGASRDDARAEVFAKQKQAQAIVKWMGDVRANPQRLMEQIKDASAIVGRAAGPQAAESYTAAALRAISFIAGHIPIRERRDPLDPRSVPPMTFDEADRLIRATKYGLHPETVYDDFEKGVITPEGLRAANTFTPDDFKEFQLELQQHATSKVLRGHMLTQSQRLRLDKLLPYPAGSDFKQANIARLQANLMKAPPEPTPANPTGGGPPPPPVDLKVQQSGFDAIEARMAG